MDKLTISIFGNQIFSEIINEIKLFSKFKLKFYDNLDLCVKEAADHDQLVIFFITKTNKKYYKKKFTILNFFNLKKISKPIEVDLIKLEDFLNNKKIIQVDLLKIDTEGSEFNVLKGLNKSINKVRLIHLEHHFDDMIIKNYKLTDIHEYLLNNNFEKIFKIK
ncbi:MAG: FkbM family methyltransferase, partial [Candidatus Pacearchaeota archaeon]|nr:FkbM family methyltransferase [Candidatus Pacearchaeota archaeon]